MISNSLELHVKKLINQNDEIINLLTQQQKQIDSLLNKKEYNIPSTIPLLDFETLKGFYYSSPNTYKKEYNKEYNKNSKNNMSSLNDSHDNINNQHDYDYLDVDFRSFNIQQLIKFLEDKEDNIKNKNYFGINLLYTIKNDLIKLNELIGLEDIKEEILDFIFHFINNGESNKDLVNFLICGEPGVGKTTLAKIFGSILSKLEIVSNEIHIISASELIGSHVGETTKKTRDSILNKNGIILIDEIYSLGGPSGTNNYGQEFANVIIADIEQQKDVPKQKRRIYSFLGYEQETEEYIFSKNKGLKSRFPFKFKLKSMNETSLKNMFIDKIFLDKYSINQHALEQIDKVFCEKNIKLFPANGRSVETLVSYIKVINSRKWNRNKTLDENDIIKGFEKYSSKFENNQINDTKLDFYI